MTLAGAIHAQLKAFCTMHGLTADEFQCLKCSWDGQMTDSEIRDNLCLTNDKMDEVIESLVSKELLQRTRTGVLMPTKEGRSVCERIEEMMMAQQ